MLLSEQPLCANISRHESYRAGEGKNRRTENQRGASKASHFLPGVLLLKGVGEGWRLNFPVGRERLHVQNYEGGEKVAEVGEATNETTTLGRREKVEDSGQ